MQNYHVIQNPAPMASEVINISQDIDFNDNDKVDTILLNEVYSERVDCLITE